MITGADRIRIAQLEAENRELKAKLAAMTEAWRAEKEEWRRLRVALRNPR